MRTLVVTGTDTGIGKTVVTAAVAALARSMDVRVAVVKPVQTGVRAGEPGDLAVVRRLSGIEDLHELARFQDPLAPATAARRAGLEPPTVAEVAEAIRRLGDRDLVLVEGAGGLLVHLDAHGGTLADLALLLAAPALVVTRPGLGTLNSTTLTCEALDCRGIACAGLVIGAWPAHPDLSARCNIRDLPLYTGKRLLGRLPEGAGALNAAEFLRVVKAGLADIADTLGLGLFDGLEIQHAG